MPDLKNGIEALEQLHPGAAVPGVVLIVRASGMTNDQTAAAADAKTRGVPPIIIEDCDVSRRAPSAA